MKDDKKIDEQWLYRMQEMILMSTDNERRRVFEAEVAQAGDAVKQEWLTHVCEEERLRLELLEVPPPPRLKECLLTIPDELKQEPRLLQRWIFTGAAVIVFIVAGFTGWKVWHHSVSVQNLHTLALLAMNDHVDDVHLDVETTDTTVLENALRDQIPFAISLPDLGSKFTLLGGRRCALGTHPVLFSRWKDSAGEYTLFQFQPSDFSLKTTMNRTLVQPKGPATERHPCEVLVWARDNIGHILVADHGAMLNKLTIQ